MKHRSTHRIALARHGPLLGCLLLALLLRLALWSQPLHQPANDEIEYVTVARDLLAGRGWQLYEHFEWLRAPLYPLFLAGSLWLAGGDLHRAALPGLLLSVANVALCYRLTLTLAGRRAAWVAALLWALLWTNVTFASLYMAETLWSALFMAGLLALAPGEGPTTNDQRPTTNQEPSASVDQASGRTAARRHGRSDARTLGRTAARRHGRSNARTLQRSDAPTLGRSNARTLQRSDAPTLGRSNAPTLGRSVARTLGRSVAPTLGRSNARSLQRSVAPPLGRSTARSLHRSVAPTLHRCAVAGLLLGLATLTRSATLLFLPLVGLWLIAQQGGPWGGWPAVGRLLRRGAPAALLFGLCAVLTIAPWTLRNALAYGRLIPVETGLAYNLWAFNEPREDIDTIARTLVAIRNPAERSDYATAKGLARLREDPAILLRKLWPNWVYLWRVKPIQDRFLQEFYYSDVSLPLFAAALVFDDALYLLIALAALAGLLGRGAPRGALRWLGLAWLLYMLATVLLTHGEARYRHFLFPVLIPFGACALAHLRGRPRAAPRRLPLALGALLLYTVLASYPWTWAGAGLGRAWHAAIGDLERALGRPAEAMASYQRALKIESTADGWLRVGALAIEQGDPARALRAYHNAAGKIPLYIAASVRLGDLLRSQGELSEARRAFAGSYASSQEVTDWAWRELRPPARAQLDLGDGLDFGYVGGVYPAEQQQGATARWTAGRGLLRLSPPAGSRASVLELRLAAPRPDSVPVPATLCAAARCWRISVGPTWRVYELSLPPATPGPLQVEVRSPTFTARDGRSLGLLLDRAALR